MLPRLLSLVIALAWASSAYSQAHVAQLLNSDTLSRLRGEGPPTATHVLGPAPKTEIRASIGGEIAVRTDEGDVLRNFVRARWQTAGAKWAKGGLWADGGWRSAQTTFDFDEPRFRMVGDAALREAWLAAGAETNDFRLGFTWHRLDLPVSGTIGDMPRIFADFGLDPQEELAKRSHRLGAVAGARIDPLTEVSVQAFEERSPGELRLRSVENVRRLRLPMSEQGSGIGISARRKFNDQVNVTLYADRVDGSGEGQALNETGGEIGEGWSQRSRKSLGFIYEQRSARGESWRLYASVADDRYRAQGLIPDARAAGLRVPLNGAAAYFLRVETTRREYGIGWTRPVGPNRRWEIDYRWIEAPTQASAGYTFAALLQTFSDRYDADLENFRTHVLDVRYGFPLGDLDAQLALRQAIPMAGGGGDGGPGTPGQSGRRSVGGWSLELQLSWTP